MNQAMFRSTSQALHFAFMIQAYEVSVENIMSKAIRAIMKELGIWNEGDPSTVDFSGLSPLEIRGQCAMIRAIVRDRLPGPEAWAIQARYGVNEIAAIDGKKRFVFSRERQEAIMNLGDWMAPSFPNFNPLAVDILIAKAVGALNKKQSNGITFREMAGQFGLSHGAYHYAMKQVGERLIALESRATDTLTPEFERDGVVLSENYCV
ncbi:hypothetical protein C8R26_13113 [Nitrosomonas oligotropha]|uniref:Uncharacterized protein n=1 Tax=Nitrosomonas oligotropha TaxID=42354 RepID=A0A2T5HGY3_9PROT|nr:hypothetical protein [Nitrosomonas oligotropha]PTQ70827.1 hypothetical protein C8R26_13113 [Nitrosomonas oligotropha]